MAEQRPSGKAEQPVCTFLFKKPGRRGAAGRRKRARSEAEGREGGGSGSSSSGDEGGAVVRPERKRAAHNPMIQKTRGGGRARAAGGQAGGNGEPSRGDERPGPEPEGPSVVYMSVLSGPEDVGATAAYAPDTDRERDARAILESGQRIRQQLLGAEHEGLYRGLQGYPQGMPPDDAAPGNAASGLVRTEPIRAPEHLRAAVRWDYQPHICKDYLETGFCGLGDSCGFLHDRSGLEQAGLIEPQPDEGRDEGQQIEPQMEPQQNEGGGDGMQIERRQMEPQPNEGRDMQIERRQVENQQVEPQQNEGGGDDGDDGSFHCFFCRQPFRDPVVTKCHFCEVCVLARYRTNPRCYLCDHSTQGTSQAPALPSTPHVSVPK